MGKLQYDVVIFIKLYLSDNGKRVNKLKRRAKDRWRRSCTQQGRIVKISRHCLQWTYFSHRLQNVCKMSEDVEYQSRRKDAARINDDKLW